MQQFCCPPFVSKTFWLFPQKSSSQLCWGHFFQFYFLLSTVSQRPLETRAGGVVGGLCWREPVAPGRAGERAGQSHSGTEMAACPPLHLPVPGVLLLWDVRGHRNLDESCPGELPAPCRRSSCQDEVGGDARLASREVTCVDGAEQCSPPSRCHCGIVKIGRRKEVAC